MMSIKQRRALVGLAAVTLVAVLAAPAALAQKKPTAPPARPGCGSVAGIMHISLADLGNNPIGKNLVSIPRVSSINTNPDNLLNNGFHKICDRLGLPAPPSGLPGDLPDIDGDGIPDNASLEQHDGKRGAINSYSCEQVLSSAPWDPKSAVQITPDLSNSSSVSLIIPGVECSQSYAVYEFGAGYGDNDWPIPLSTTCATRDCICDQLNLPIGTSILTFDAVAGSVEQYDCNVPRDLDTFTRGTGTAYIPSGEGARIQPPGSVTAAGLPLNCLSGLPCPHTDNVHCLGAGSPDACCTGFETGTCEFNAPCTGAGTPYACCTGATTGTCDDDYPKPLIF